MQRIYLDNNASTRPYQEVIKDMDRTMTKVWGNPAAQYEEGRAAQKLLDEARQIYGAALNCNPEFVFFTSGGTESNNIALRTVMTKAVKAGQDVLITSNIEHPSVKRTADLICGCIHVAVPVDKQGFVTVNNLMAILEQYGRRVGMVSIMFAHNEFGTIQRIAGLSKAVKTFASSLGIEVPFHSDATQMLGKYANVHPAAFGVDLMSASAHKFHGPRGVGLLYAANGILDKMFSPITGGGQESGCRSGTENVAAIHASALALRYATADPNKWLRDKTATMRGRDYIANVIRTGIPNAAFNGDTYGALYNTLNVSLPYVVGHDMVKALDEAGVSISSGSACSKGEASASIKNLYANNPMAEHLARNAIRVTLSSMNTMDECERAAHLIVKVYNSLVK